jgi:hypothetical protein
MLAEKKGFIIPAALLLAAAVFLMWSNVCNAELSLSSDTPVVNFHSATVSDLYTGYIEIGPSPIDYAIRLSVTDTETANWIIRTKAGAPDFYSFGSSKPCADLKWRINNSGLYTGYTTFDSTVARGAGDANVDIDYKMIAKWSDAPGSYSISIIFTIAEDI